MMKYGFDYFREYLKEMILKVSYCSKLQKNVLLYLFIQSLNFSTSENKVSHLYA